MRKLGTLAKKQNYKVESKNMCVLITLKILKTI